MSRQALDLRKSALIVRRYKFLFGGMILLGLAVGCLYSALRPPLLASQALVVLPAASASSGPTEVVVAGSDPVLVSALPRISPAMTLTQLHDELQVTGLTNTVLSVVATDTSATQAESIANAVADSYVTYVDSAASPVGDMHAHVLEAALSATGPSKFGRVVLSGGIGALAGALIGLVISLAIGRNDRRLRERDEIANSVGLPVMASFPSGRPRDAADWGKLLTRYDPPAVYAWQLRRMLGQLGITGRPADAGPASITLLSVSGDVAAVALGPQIATFAASLGVPTLLVVAPQQDATVLATLRTACAAAPDGVLGGTRPLRVTVADEASLDGFSADLTISVVVADREAPRMSAVPRTTLTVLGVGAGAVTAEQLARTVTIAAADSRDVAGIVVADPDAADATTGRVPRMSAPERSGMPTRTTGIPTESSRW